MTFILTDHARRRCVQRKILVEWIQRALENPARLVPDSQYDALLHALYPIPERAFKVLRVIYNETIVPVAVVTAYFDDEVTDL